jgi:light-regulated signal transduction histidine kinase (bacteriophytochrome)
MVNLLEEKDLPLVRALSGQSVDNFEIFIQNQSKPEGIWVEVTSRPLKDKKGDIIGGVAALRDVSVSKRAESVLMELNSKLQESNEQLQQFAYTASHDLQEPLRVIASFSELLESKYKDKLDKDATDYIEFITSAASRMQNLISDLLAYSRISTQAQTLAPSNISQALKAALANLQLVIEEKNAKISFDEIPPVLADEKQIVQVFQNLISNALKFCDHSNPEISISANKNMGMVTIAIKDNGIGIDTKFKDKIFDMFKRLHAVGKYPGTGMGLSICKKIVERHKGRIWAESEPGHGSTFYFTLKAAGTLEALDTDSPEAD